MPLVDFSNWVDSDLTLELGERRWTVPLPDVAAAKKILAAAVRAEINLGLVKGVTEVPAEVQGILDTIEPGDHPALGPVYKQLHDAGVNPEVIDRMAYYAVFYWARGEEYAEAIATLLWAPREAGGKRVSSRPKARPTSRRKTGRRSESAKS